MRKTILLLAAGLALAGCARIHPEADPVSRGEDKEVSQKSEVLTCNGKSGEISFSATGDDVSSTRHVFYRTLEELNIESDPEAEVAAINKELQEEYGKYKGLDVSAELADDQVRYTVTVDFKTADMDALEKAGVLEPGQKESQYVSLSKTRQQFESDGYACTIK